VIETNLSGEGDSQPRLRLRAVPRLTTSPATSRRESAGVPSSEAFEDSALIEFALAGQSDCFAALTNRYLPAVRRRIGSIIPNRTDADDVLQEVLVKVWLHLSTFRSESTFQTWMTRVAINEALQSYRRMRSKAAFQPARDFDVFVSPNDSPYQSLAREQTAQVLRKAIVELPSKYREMVILRDLEQLSVSETSERLQLTVAAVKSRLYRARLMLSTALRR
jgi:RNA polymerase sigma-70 factor, ECF subfamily